MVNQLQDFADIVNGSTLTDMPRVSVRRRARGEGGSVDLSGNVSKLSAAAGHSLARSPHIRTYSGSPIVRFTCRHCRARPGGARRIRFRVFAPRLRGDPLSFWLWLGRMLILFDQVRWQQSHHLRPFFLPRARLSLLLPCAQSDAISVAPLLVPGDADCIL